MALFPCSYCPTSDVDLHCSSYTPSSSSSSSSSSSRFIAPPCLLNNIMQHNRSTILTASHQMQWPCTRPSPSKLTVPPCMYIPGHPKISLSVCGMSPGNGCPVDSASFQYASSSIGRGHISTHDLMMRCLHHEGTASTGGMSGHKIAAMSAVDTCHISERKKDSGWIIPSWPLVRCFYGSSGGTTSSVDVSAARKFDLVELIKRQGHNPGDGGSNSGHGGLGGNGGDGGYGDFFSSGPEDHARGCCYGLTFIMMDLQGLCDDINEGECSEHTSLLESLKAMLSSLFSLLLSYQGHVKPLYKYADIDDNYNASVIAIDHRDGDDKELSFFPADRGNIKHNHDEAITHGEYRENNMNLLKLEHEKYGFLGQEHVSMHRSYEGLVSNEAIISWFALPALAKVAVDQATSAKSGDVSIKEPVTMTKGLDGDSPTQIHGSGGDPTVAKQSDLEIMKRLQREVFSELMKIRERLEKIEQIRQSSDQQRGAKTRLKGEAKAGVAFVLIDDISNSRQARDALVNAGMQSGLDVSFTFETRFRERDTLTTLCVSGQGSSVGDGRALGGSLALGKLQYVTHVSDDFSLSFVPLGAQGKDVTEIVNALQDKGVTAFSSQGPALFNHCKGSALGATVSGSMFAFSIGQYLSGWGNQSNTPDRGTADSGDPLCLGTLGQLLIQPIEGIIVSVSGLSRYWPSPPLPSSMGLHWSEMGPLVIPKFRPWKKHQPHAAYPDPIDGSPSHSSSPRSHWESSKLEYGMDSSSCKGTSSFSFAFSSSMDLSENINISAWAQIEKGDSLQDLDIGNIEWAINLSKNSGNNGIDWGASIGSCRSNCYGWDRDNHNPQLQMEAFLRIDCGKGFTLQPGLLYISNNTTQTPACIIQSNWSL